MTKWWEVPLTVDAAHPIIREAAASIRAGETVAFPTETVYGLGADAGNDEAVAQIYTAKGRPSDNPLIVHIGDRSELDCLIVESNSLADRLMDAFWPGPLTMVMPAVPGVVSHLATAGLPTVAVRMPDHPVALALLRAAGCPIVAPSANRSGRPSPTSARHVRDDLYGRIGGILDGGQCQVGIESTVVEVVGDEIHVLRPGGISVEQLRDALPDVAVRAAAETGEAEVSAAIAEAGESPTLHDGSPRSPGMKYMHYAPRGRFAIVHGSSESEVADWVLRRLLEERRSGERTGVLTFQEHMPRYPADQIDLVVDCGSASNPRSVAFRLYDALRQFDDAGVTVIYTDCYYGHDHLEGEAIMNRLRKAANHHIIQI